MGDLRSTPELASSSARNWGVTVLAKSGAHGIQFASLVITARLLTPADFGLFAMIMAVIGIAGLFRDLGLSTATIRIPRLTSEQANTLFWINACSGLAVALLVCAAAPLVASFYDDPRIAPIAAALSLNFFFGGLAAQHGALLQRGLRFGALASIRVLTAVSSGGLAVALALAGFGIWALVWSGIASGALGAWLNWRACPWRPGRPRFDRSAREAVSFGGYMMVFGFLNFVARNLHNVLMGAMWGPATVGLYNRAHGFMTTLVSYLLEPLSTVTPPTLSRLASEPAAFSGHYYRMATALTLLSAPLSAVLVLLADDIVAVLFGPQWHDSAALLKTLAIGIVPQALCHTSGWIYLCLGNPRAMMKWGIVGWSFIIGCLLVGLAFGLSGVAAAYTLGMFLLFWPCMSYAFRGTGLTVGRLLTACWPPVAAAILAGAPAWWITLLLESWTPAGRIPAVLGVFGTLYTVILIFGLGQRQLLAEIATQLRRPRSPRS
ncbi:MAG: lipopolysaccharide biosynthesis protein [Gammaproteobacteria bacterium]|nr:lipopolysaccharide biosynthesis protein [Gammaproteobacteria bacterium]